MNSLKKIKAEKIHVTLTLAEVDALVMAANHVPDGALVSEMQDDLESAFQKLDEAVNQ